MQSAITLNRTLSLGAALLITAFTFVSLLAILDGPASADAVAQQPNQASRLLAS
jgi:hypothetical protein